MMVEKIWTERDVMECLDACAQIRANKGKLTFDSVAPEFLTAAEKIFASLPASASTQFFPALYAAIKQKMLAWESGRA